MKIIIRICTVLVLFVIALSLYSHGHQTGMFVFIALGFLCECAFWLNLFPKKRKGNASH